MNGELAEPADPDRETCAAARELAAHPPRRAVRGQPGVAERGGARRVEPLERQEVTARRHGDDLGVAAVALEAGLHAGGAELLLASRAGGAAAASPCAVDEHRPEVVGLARDLVPQDERLRELRVLAVEEMDVRVADPCAEDAHEHLVAGPLGNRPLLEDEGLPVLAENGGSHRRAVSPTSRKPVARTGWARRAPRASSCGYRAAPTAAATTTARHASAATR